jgi:hypothetical protein
MIIEYVLSADITTCSLGRNPGWLYEIHGEQSGTGAHFSSIFSCYLC